MTRAVAHARIAPPRCPTALHWPADRWRILIVQPSHQQRDPEHLSSEIGRGIDDATEALRWCKDHMQERRASEILRLAHLNLGYLALALDWQMEGELDKAFSALDRIWWHPHQAGGQQAGH